MEPRGNTDEFKATIAAYHRTCENETAGAIFFAVCRGKVSEGLDFSNRYGRAVVLTGIPYASKNDAKVQLKQDYLNQSQSSTLSGNDWYLQQATRAVNQAVGRVIRHRRDYGAIILCDERFSGHIGHLSKWLQPHVQLCKNYGEVHKSMVNFYKTNSPLDIPLVQKSGNLAPMNKLPFQNPMVGTRRIGTAFGRPAVSERGIVSQRTLEESQHVEISCSQGQSYVNPALLGT